MAADYDFPIRDPNSPASGRAKAIFPADLTVKWYKYSPVRYQNLVAARDVLENTKRILGGVREFNAGGWCFVGKPKNWYIREQEKVVFPQDLVFAVYLNPNLRVYECRAERIAPDDPYCPIDWKNRFRSLVWKHTS